MPHENEHEEAVAIDWRGNAYSVDSTVLYPRMSGRSCEMQEGTVLKIVAYPDTKYVLNPKRGEEGERWSVLTDYIAYKIKVQPTNSSRDFGRWSDKPVWIQIGENVTAVT